MRTFPHHCRKITVVITLLLALSLLACGVGADPSTDAPTDTPGAGIPEGDLGLTIRNISTGQTITAEDVGEFQEHIPFGIVVPEYLPDDVQLASMSGSVGGPGRVRAESVDMSFHSTEAGQSLNLMQAGLPEGMDGMGISGESVEDIAIGDVMGKLQETEEPDRHFITMVWTGCGLDFTLIAQAQRGREELLRVAESTLACRGLE